MDIEGYEGHALEGATQLLSAGTPVVAEFNPRFLTSQDGWERFCDALAHRRIFDLAKAGTLCSLESLARDYAESSTDILAVHMAKDDPRISALQSH
jgi:hypothetical protein